MIYALNLMVIIVSLRCYIQHFKFSRFVLYMWWWTRVTLYYNCFKYNYYYSYYPSL